MPNAKRNKCSKALRTRVAGYTNIVFEQCVREVLGLVQESKEELDMAMDFIRQAQSLQRMGAPVAAIYDEDELKEMIDAQERVAALYQVKIKSLPTKHLNEILKAHELDGGLKRASNTVETILNELTRRAILDDSGESDFISNNGDVDEPIRKSKRNSPKTINKKRKAVKSR